MLRVQLSLVTICFSVFACEDESLTRLPDEMIAIPADVAPSEEPAPVDPVDDTPVSVPPPRVHASEIYGHTLDTLFAFDPDNMQARMIGEFHPFNGEQMVDIAIDGNG